MEELLRSRFECGMIADMGEPDLETRMEILKTKCQERKINFSEEILNYIATNIQRNIRELEGALNILIAYQTLNKLPPDLKIAKDLLKNFTSPQMRVVNARQIIQAVADFYDLKERDLISSSRKKEIVRPRQIAMYLLREQLKASFPFIGRKFGGKDHTTAIHSYEKIVNEVGRSSDLLEEINLIKQRVLSG